MTIKKVAILTSGGDAPGMNKLLHSCCEQLISNNITPYVVINGFLGLYENDIREANMKILLNNAHNSGSVIYCSRFYDHFKEEVLLKEVKNLKDKQIDLLIVIGGNGSYAGAQKLIEKGINVICLPATIDNDINFTQYSIGFDSALSEIVDTIDNLNFTTKTHGNIFLIEVMGRECSDLTLFSAQAAKVDYIITKHNKLQKEQFVDIINKTKKYKRGFLFLITENVYDQDYLNQIREFIQLETNIPTKTHIIGHRQRGAKPTAMERYNAVRFAQKCLDCITNNIFNVAIGIDGEKFIITKLLNNNFLKQRDGQEVLEIINSINNKTK